MLLEYHLSRWYYGDKVDQSKHFQNTEACTDEIPLTIGYNVQDVSHCQIEHQQDCSSPAPSLVPNPRQMNSEESCRNVMEGMKCSDQVISMTSRPDGTRCSTSLVTSLLANSTTPAERLNGTFTYELGERNGQIKAATRSRVEGDVKGSVEQIIAAPKIDGCLIEDAREELFPKPPYLNENNEGKKIHHAKNSKTQRVPSAVTSIGLNPFELLPNHKYQDPMVAMHGNSIICSCKNSVHFFELDYDDSSQYVSSTNEHKRWRKNVTIPMQHVYCNMPVSVYGNTAVVGVPADVNDQKIKTGAVYIFEKTPECNLVGNNNEWKLVAKHTPSTPFNGDGNDARGSNYGYAVSVHHDVIVVGAPCLDRPIGVKSDTAGGRVYILRRSKINDGKPIWKEHAILKPESPSLSDHFGVSVAVNEAAVVAAAGQGSVFLFEYDSLSKRYHQKGKDLLNVEKNKKCILKRIESTSLELADDGGIFVGSSLYSDVLCFNRKTNSTNETLVAKPHLHVETLPQGLNLSTHPKLNISFDQDSGTLAVGVSISNTFMKGSASNRVCVFDRSGARISVIKNEMKARDFGNSVAIVGGLVVVASSSNAFVYNIM